MDQPDKRIKKGKKYPRVPIKTYKWEDIRRSRRKGGYPWTYLYKQPFAEELDPQPYTMEELRKSKSSSTLGKSEGVEISEVSSETGKDSFGAYLDIPDKLDTLQIITDPDDHSIKNSTSSIVIEECEMSDACSHKPENIALESAESSDNISQYLDKDEPGPDNAQELGEKFATSSESNENKTADEGNQDNASQEPKRKRKLSAESSYSKISLTKQAMLKKIKDAKNKIKIPKLSFPTSKLKRPVAKRNKNSPPETKKETKKDVKKQHTQTKNVKPVYIHIPLKPPPGQTDEFSYLEFEEKSDKPPPTKRIGSFKDILRNIKQLQEANSEGEMKPNEAGLSQTDDVVLIIEVKNENDVLKQETDETITAIEPNTITEILETSDIIIVSQKDLEDASIVGNEAIVEPEKSGETAIPQEDQGTAIPEDASELKTSDDTANLVDDDKITSSEEHIDTTLQYENEEPEPDMFEKLFEAGASTHVEKESQKPDEKKARSKSAEPERRRKLSLESSYSRKSLSKLGILKALKETSDKIKKSLSRSSSKKQTKLTEPVVKKATKIKKDVKSEKEKKPVYIHIPLKPPEGQTDEFSYLEYDEKQPTQTEEERNRVSSSPDTPLKGDVQFIILTAPSDDEILDYHSSDVPETPSSDNKLFFGNKIDELKELAKDIADEVTPALTPPPILKKLDPVTEETNSDKVNVEETNSDKVNVEETNDVAVPDNSTTKEVNETEKIMVDVEDGLNEPFIKQSVVVESKEELTIDPPVELKSNLKDEVSPTTKKKVSFRRRSKTPKDGIYEDIQIPKVDANKQERGQEQEEADLDINQSMSVGEEKTYLDEKIMKSTSLDEDYNKWSKMSDHEYEPVNPPPDTETFPSPTPTVRITIEPSNLHPIGHISSETVIYKETMVEDEGRHQTEPVFLLQKEADINTPIPTSATTGEKQTLEEGTSVQEKSKEGPSKFQLAFKQTTDQFKNKLHNIKKPHITMPDKSKFKKLKIEKSKFKFPTIPDTTKITLPSFSLPRRNTAKRSLKERQQSTESNAGDSKKPLFDFSTYPRIFKKKSKSQRQNQEAPDFATALRSSGKTSSTATDDSSTRIPLHSEESMDTEYREELNQTRLDSEEKSDENREDSVERRMASHIRYEEDIDIDGEFERENHEINRDNYPSRWDHGNFNPEPNQEYLNNYKNSEYKVTDLDSPEEVPGERYDFNSNNKENYSSGSSLGGHRVGGVLEEINSDEFFLRQKGISQDNIEVGMYLSSEIREAFRMPENALSKMQVNYEHAYDPRGSNQSLPEAQNKRKPKKPKRKKTPHVSQEQIPYAEESAEEDFDVSPPSRPKRRSKRIRKSKNFNDVIPYQETISLDTNNPDERLLYHRESLGILGDDEREIEANIMYENERMEGKEHPEIQITDPYKNFEFVNIQHQNGSNRREHFEDNPIVPPRKHKSLKSLDLSESDSILGDFSLNKEPESENDLSRVHLEYSTYPKDPPKRPSRITSRTSSQSKGTSQLDDESLSRRTESLTSENQIPCVEEPCIQDIRDSMGYAIIDKQKVRDPPLPPPRTPIRRKRSTKASENKFFTVPRPSKDESVPVRPLRNYSTLGQTKKIEPATYENKENIDITQYIEIEDEPNRDLQSGDIIKKMKDRPLPAPPRPPRKSRPLRDITSKENIMSEDPQTDTEKLILKESEMSTQTEPLPDDFVCEEVTQDTDTAFLSSNIKESNENPVIERRLITPSYYTHEETITHGSLLVAPLDGSKILPDSEITSVSTERIIPITTASDDEEVSSIPEDFNQLKDPPQESKELEFKKSEPLEKSVNTGVDTLKAQKLEVIDLDVDTLTVNKLLAGKIIVSEIDSSNIQTNEISSRSGALKIGEIELPPGIINEIIKSITSKERESNREQATELQEGSSVPGEDDIPKQKKTPIDSVDPETLHQITQIYLDDTECENIQIVDDESHFSHQTSSLEPDINDEVQNEPPQPPPRISDLQTTAAPQENTSENSEGPQPPPRISDLQTTAAPPENTSENSEGPQRPPRQSDRVKESQSNDEMIQELDDDDEPPPRPPQPHVEYLPSQPPASFYALRAQKYVDTYDDNIPVVPRRRRQPKSKPISRSSSEESSVTPITRRLRPRSPEPSISQLSGQLVRACGSTANDALKRLIVYITNNVFENADGKQDLHVMIIILLVLIAGLILLGYGEDKTVVHLHHWEYFNPPRDM